MVARPGVDALDRDYDTVKIPRNLREISCGKPKAARIRCGKARALSRRKRGFRRHAPGACDHGKAENIPRKCRLAARLMNGYATRRSA
jgi:hypothetical protein